MKYRVLCLERDGKVFMPVKAEDVFHSAMAADTAATQWVTESSGRQAIVVADRQTHWSAVEAYKIPGGL